MFDPDVPLFIKTIREHPEYGPKVAHLSDVELGGVFDADYRTGWSQIGGPKAALSRIKALLETEGTVRPPRNQGGFGGRLSR